MDDYNDYDLESCMDCGKLFKMARCEPDIGLCDHCLQLHLDNEPQTKGLPKSRARFSH